MSRLRPVSGVLADGVAGQRRWAGLGVTLTKSAKLKAALGVVLPKAKKGWPPGVFIMDDGSGVCLLGGVDGGCTGEDLLTCSAGEGDDAR